MNSRLGTTKIMWSVVALAVFAVLLLPTVASAQEIGDDLVRGENTNSGKGYMRIYTVARINGSDVNLPVGAGWRLIDYPSGYSGSTSQTYNSQPSSPRRWPSSGPLLAKNGHYEIEGKPVAGWTISYNPYGSNRKKGWLNGHSYNHPFHLKVLYSKTGPKTGDLRVIVLVDGGGTIPAGGGYNLSGPATDNVNAGGQPSGFDKDYNDTPEGIYTATGKPVGGWSISYRNSDNRSPSNTTNLGSVPDDDDWIKVIYKKLPEPPKFKVITVLEGGGNLPQGSGWDLTTKPSGSGATPSSKNTSGLLSEDTQYINNAKLGYYKVTGRPVDGYMIMYDPRDGTLGGGDDAPPSASPSTGGGDDGGKDLCLKVIYKRNTGKLKVVTVLVGGGNLPGGSGWDLTTKPGDFSGTPSKNTSGDSSPDTETINPAETGDYTVTGRPVNGFTISYDPQSVTLGKGQTKTLKVKYTRIEPAKLIIDIEPNGGVPGGSYSVDGPPGFADQNNQQNDQTINIDGSGSKPFGTYVVTFTDAAGHSETVTVEQGDFSGGALSKSGSVDPGETHEIKGVYRPDGATLKIDIQPNGGVPGGSYSVDGPPGFADQNNQQNDQTINIDGSGSKPFGTYTVTFTDATGYSETVTVEQGDFGGGGLSRSGSVDPGETHEIKGVYKRDTGKLNVITELTGGGTLPTGSGWDLDDPKPEGFSGTPDNKDTGGQPSGDDQGITPAATGDYSVTGRGVTGYTITYGPQNGTLTKDGSLTLKVIYTRDTGSLNVITELTGGGTLPAGAGWDLDDPKPEGFSGTPDNKDTGGQPSGDDQGINPAVTGDYSVTGRAVTGYSISYGPKNGTLAKDGSLTLKVIYTRDTGSLNVITELTGGGTLPAGAGWDLDDPKPGGFTGTPTSRDNGGQPSGDDQGISPAVTGDYSVTGRAVTGHSISYGPKNGTLTKGGSLTLKVIYTRTEGEALNVITELAGGGTLPDGSGWDLSSTPGGFVGIPAGKDTSGLGSGDNQFITPVVTGDYTVDGRAVAGYTISYDPQSGNLGGGGSLTLKVIYTVIPVGSFPVDAIYWDPVNGVQVPGGSISPPNASVNDGDSQNFGTTTLPTGYVLTGGSAFTGTAGGNSVNVGANLATVTNVTGGGTMRIYVELSTSGPGELEVIILPGEVNTDGARWKFKNSGSLKTTGTVETLDPGFYDLEAIDVPDWITPPAQTAQVFSGQRTTVTFVYGQQVVGALQVFITDNVDERVRKLGAQWQPIFPPSFGLPNDPDKWYNHGDIISGLPPGVVGLRFKFLSGWIYPELTGAEVFPNETTKETGRYWRVLIIHKSDYNGDGTDDLAVFNKSKRQWQVASISKPAGGPAATFDLFEKKFGRSDDIATSGDYDGDGIADLAYWRETTGEWRVSKQFKLKNFGEMHDIPVPGDYDADGRTDPALYRPSTGEWFIYDRDLKEIITVNFGSPTHVPVPGNYDADEGGRTDLAIFDVNSQQWRVAFWNEKKEQWIEKKKIRVGGRKIKLRDNHGSIGNVPVHADYDGDGATDLAIYKRRPSMWDIRDQFEIELGEHLDVPVPNDWAGLGRVIPTIFNVQKGRWISIDDLLDAKHGKGGQPLMSGR